jgi:hypothetical protein
VITVRLEDPDRTTDTVRGELTSGGISEAIYFRDDGNGGDLAAGDDIWTHRSNWVVSDGSWAKVEVWAVDDDLVSPGLVHTVPIVKRDSGPLSFLLSGVALPILILSMSVLALAGAAYQRRRTQEIAKDMQIIESWSSFDPRELDEEFDSD